MKINYISLNEMKLKDLGFNFDKNDGKFKINMKSLRCEINSWDGLIKIISSGNDKILFSKEIIQLVIKLNSNFIFLEDLEDEK